jgi:hypothetical protein
VLYRQPVMLVQPRARPWSLSRKAREAPCLTLIRPKEATTIRRDPLVG